MQATTIRLTTQELASRRYMGDKVIINGMLKSYSQLRNMKGKTYLVSVTSDGHVNTLTTINVQTIKPLEKNKI